MAYTIKHNWLAILSCITAILIVSGCSTETNSVEEEMRERTYHPRVITVLNEKKKVLEQLVQTPEIVLEVKRANAERGSMSEQELQDMDGKWQEHEAMYELMTNQAAQSLIQFAEEHAGFLELFVTDRQGINVAQTNTTTDYVQHDEGWWQRAYNDGRGALYHGWIEYDESIQSESIPLGVPVFDEGGRLIGILKAILNVSQVQQEAFWNTYQHGG